LVTDVGKSVSNLTASLAGENVNTPQTGKREQQVEHNISDIGDSITK